MTLHKIMQRVEAYAKTYKDMSEEYHKDANKETRDKHTEGYYLGKRDAYHSASVLMEDVLGDLHELNAANG